VLALLTGAITLLAGEWLIPLMHTEESALVSRYLRFLLAVVPFMMCEAVSIACLRGAGDMVTGLVAMSLVNVVNIAVAWTLLLGIGPLSSLGWDSLCIGTSCGYAVGGLIPLVVLLRGRAGLRIQRRLLRPDTDLIRRIVRIGLPAGIDQVSVIGCQLLFVSIINGLGDLAMAAHGVAIKIESLAYLPGTAFQVAAATLAGQYLGAGNYRQATRSVLGACVAGIGLMGFVGLVLYFGADKLARLFVSSEQLDVAQLSASLLRIVSCVMVPLALMMVLNGALRGAGDTRWPLLFTFIGLLGVRMPTAYLFTDILDWGVRGAWYAMVADLTVRCLLVSYRFLHGGWKHIEV
jgi:putative MATE family efflux protein